MRALSEIVDEINSALDMADCTRVRSLLTEAFPVFDARTVVKMVAELAESSYSKNRLVRAEQFLRLALALHEKCFPAEIPARFAKRKLAEILQEQEKYEEATMLLASLELKP